MISLEYEQELNSTLLLRTNSVKIFSLRLNTMNIHTVHTGMAETGVCAIAMQSLPPTVFLQQLG